MAKPTLSGLRRWESVGFAALLFALSATAQTNPFLGEIRLFAGNFAPVGWALCDGSLLPISQNAALFSLLGTTYGGDGKTTFALPDLRGRAPIGMGNGIGLTPRLEGSTGGLEQATLSITQLPSHTHTISIDS